MQILLFILKIIGIILLVLLGLIFLVLALVLFVPIRYEVNGEIEDEYKIEAGGVIRYLFSIVKIIIAYRNGDLDTDIYLFGFRKRKKVLDMSEESEPDEVPSDSEDADDIEMGNSIKEDASSPANIKKEPQQLKQPTIKFEKEKKVKAKPAKKSRNEENKFSIELIKAELTDEHNHNVLKKIFRELKYLFAHFGFRKIKTDLFFCAGDPALTGQILGILAMFPILYRYEFGIIPDFESDKAYIKGTFNVVGRIRLIHILVTSCRLIFDKEVRMVIKKFMNMRNQ